jgi:hypothetical protein
MDSYDDSISNAAKPFTAMKKSHALKHIGSKNPWIWISMIVAKIALNSGFPLKQHSQAV